ncbi:MAG: hypothetical protein ACREL9_08970 [Gemmatimonadales bacterium]
MKHAGYNLRHRLRTVSRPRGGRGAGLVERLADQVAEALRGGMP